MDWSNERYVRVYTRDTTTWKILSWEARALLQFLIRKVDRSGVVDTGRHGARGLFRGLNDSFEATRYHSLVVDRATCPTALRVTAEADGLIMGLEHADRPLHGVQFHPERIRSQHGVEIVKNFLDLAAAWNTARDRTRADVH